MLDNDICNRVFVIIPVLNERWAIKEVIQSLLPFGFAIVIIDDGSSENMKEEIDLFDSVHYLKHKVNLGQGAALQTGIEFSLQYGADFIITFDGDGQHSAEDIPSMLKPLQQKFADVTLASRFLKEDLQNASWARRIVLKAGCILNYLFTGIYLSDAHNGLRAMTRSTAQKIKIKENRMAHATEFLFLIQKHHLRYQEIPAKITYSWYSKKKGQSLFNSVRITFDLVLHKLFE